MRVACIDIGSNTTRLLVSQRGTDSGLHEVHRERAFNAIELDDNAIPASKLSQIATVVATQARHARQHGAVATRVVATGIFRTASNSSDALGEIAAAAGLPVDLLPPADEARLAFRGGVGVLGTAPAGTLAVVDVGGGSTEIAVGRAGGVEWWRSVPIGSAVLAADLGGAALDRHRLEVLHERAQRAFAPIRPPQVDWAWAVGGSAQSLHRIAGDLLGAEALDHALDLLCNESVASVAARYELEPERVALLPAGMVVLRWASALIGCQLRVGSGGLREGIVLELLDAISSSGEG